MTERAVTVSELLIVHEKKKKNRYLKLQNPATVWSYHWHLPCSLLPLKLALFVLLQHLTRSILINSNLNKQECLKQMSKHCSGSNASFFYKGHGADSKPIKSAVPVTCRWVLLATMLGNSFLTWGSWTGLIMREIVMRCENPALSMLLNWRATQAEGARFPTETIGILGSLYATSSVIFTWAKQLMLVSSAVAQNSSWPWHCARYCCLGGHLTGTSWCRKTRG